MFFCGGTTVSPDLIRSASETVPNCLFFRCYGSTEMISATLGINDAARARLGAETDGEIVPPVELASSMPSPTRRCPMARKARSSRAGRASSSATSTPRTTTARFCPTVPSAWATSAGS
jgi:acyl-CoA synthetase (AMP-forming)/AMP-acid ligase II